MLPKLAFEKMKIRTASLGEQSSIPDLLGEVIQQNRLEFRLDEDDEIYERYPTVNITLPSRKAADASALDMPFLSPRSNIFRT